MSIEAENKLFSIELMSLNITDNWLKSQLSVNGWHNNHLQLYK